MTDYSALAAQFGGVPVDSGTDYAELARKFGGQAVNAQPPQPKYSDAVTRPEVNLPFGLGTIRTPDNESGFNLPAAIISAGKSLTSLNEGLTQAQRGPADWLLQKFGMPADPVLQGIEQSRRDRASADQQLAAVHPGSVFLGETAPAAVAPWRVLPAIAAADYGSPQDRATAAGVTYLGGRLAQAGGNALGKLFAGSEASALASQQANAGRDAVTQLARANNLVVPPELSNPTIVNRVLGGLAGGAKNEQAASLSNEPRFIEMAKQGLGLGKDQPLNENALAKYRADAYQSGYVPVKSVPSYVVDQQFANDVAALRPDIQTEIPEMANAGIENTIKALSKPQFTGNTAIELTRRLRYDASANFKNALDPEKQALARAQLGAADAMEGLIERNLAATGDQAKLAAFQKARQQIAMSHTVENALVNERVNPKEILKQDNGQLQGPLKDIARFAEQYPMSSQVIDRASKGNPFSTTDAMVTSWPAVYAGLEHGALPGLAVAAAGVAARPALRATMMSQPYQKFMTQPSYNPSGLLRAGRNLLDNEQAPWLMGLLGYKATN